ncbi:MAG: 1-acyl-sn-glycerol-3-phosphate acyltransferase, partial [Bacteroidetes bacterium]|nr:1-acyl-sn-glycerol-3-phosphate acyltransferase [Bacteroidota bacterium]
MTKPKYSFYYTVVGSMLRTCFYTFYKRFETNGLENIPIELPTLYVSNHQNSLMDPLVISISQKKQPGFLARADVFKNPKIAKYLYGLKMNPIYRIRDGVESLKLNDEIFDRCSNNLSQNDAIILFPEGSHLRKRNLRQFKKGFSRIAFTAESSNDFSLNVMVIPIGLNYSEHIYANSDLLINYGKPINVTNYKERYLENPQMAMFEIREEVYQRMKELMVHIENEEYYTTIDELRTICREIVFEKLEIKENTLANQLKADQYLVKTLENKIETDKAEIETLKEETVDYLKELKKHKINEVLMKKNPGIAGNLLMSFLLILISPLFLFIAINNAIPYSLIRLLIKKKIKDDHFHSSIKVVA